MEWVLRSLFAVSGSRLVLAILLFYKGMVRSLRTLKNKFVFKITEMVCFVCVKSVLK